MAFSMLERETLRFGLIWKIGDGETVHACRDAWIPKLASGKISLIVLYDSNILVKDLLLPTKRWDLQKLENLFPLL